MDAAPTQRGDVLGDGGQKVVPLLAQLFLELRDLLPAPRAVQLRLAHGPHDAFQLGLRRNATIPNDAINAALGAASGLKNPPAGYAPDGYTPPDPKAGGAGGPYAAAEDAADLPLADYVLTGQYGLLWLIFFLNITAGISIISFQSPLYQDVWKLDHPTLERSVLAGYGATLIAISSLFNGFGRIVWGAVSARLGRINTFRLLLASQLVVIFSEQLHL